MRVRDRQSHIETPVHVLAHRNGLSGTPRKKEKKLRPRRRGRSGPVGKERVTLLSTVAGCALTSRKDVTIHSHQLQGVGGAGAVPSLAQHRLALRIATYDYVGVRFAIRYEFIAKQPIFDNRQQVYRQANR